MPHSEELQSNIDEVLQNQDFKTGAAEAFERLGLSSLEDVLGHGFPSNAVFLEHSLQLVGVLVKGFVNGDSRIDSFLHDAINATNSDSMIAHSRSYLKMLVLPTKKKGEDHGI
ncbi:hypothetical protein [Marinobacter lutaoensis]|uniref:hypothetical protein n=1 Tax=Marinobacter lutaoensis TaxID=135739 RepID=UPI0011155948|nr:hypothetical protein [Marinobacter lutaoensis]